MTDFIMLHAREDGTFVVALNGLPYHVLESDPLYPYVLDVYTSDPTVVTPETPPTGPLPPPEISKNSLYARMTDAEMDTLDHWINNIATVRQRRRWDDATALVLSDPELVAVAEALYGSERAAELLAP